MEAENLKVQILELVKKYYQTAHQKSGFEPGKSRINYSGRVYDDQELVNLVDSSLDFWLTAGPYGNKFESKMRDFFSSRDFLLVNSGSSANLLMVSTICSPELKSQKDTQLQPLEPGDEVITPAVTFPTTLAPIIQNRLIPVFVDCEVGTYNINPHLIEDAVGPRTKAIFIPHTVGNPCNMEIIMDVAKRHNLWVLEDSCDALGATFDGTLVGTFGQMASLSFYPAHHMTMGEGGAVIVNQASLKKTVLSLRDWGRSCWCPPGISDSCSKRFNWELGELPFGYDHKYIYSNIGYNLKVTDMQAAIGIAQKEKVEGFIEKRRHNFWRLYEGLKSLEEYLILPKIDSRANPSPFGFPITVKEGINRRELVQHLEAHQIETRLVFGGNILKQPGFMNIERRVHGTLEESDIIMNRTLFTGVFPGLTDEMIDYVIEQFTVFFKKDPVNSSVTLLS
ncbi:DegT/DnrJ/EryC1/StrS aminotransferase [Trichodesmium erythraeum IMS101]|uniref:DegT/DnrJ/EryC1/StrS aminotransferase n=1 Tax=Trichodesmium erythraeum (strain IMS101) TaxID=203124 RepID=Q112T5_TRIEI|nr:lipopolysaccharide biosynthesis protein RfbH [Trichodesmium erythraeum GBRTRLIN201]